MWFHSLFDALLARTSRTRSQKTRPAPSLRRRSHPFRPRLEDLEERSLLSANSYVVNLAGDAGTGSGLTGDIRYCVTQADQSANAGSTITFDTAKTGSTITLSHGYLVISDAMTINGPGAGSLTISGNNASRLFDVAFGGSLTLEKVTLSGGLVKGTGAGAEGGAIYSSGTLALGGVTVKSNEVQGSSGAVGGNGANAYGGGIYVAGGSVTLNNDTLRSNQAAGAYGSGGAGLGGGLYVAAGSVKLNNDTVRSNHAIGAYGSGGAGLGGGLYVAEGSVALTNDTLSSNQAVGVFGGVGSGGGLDVAGGNVTLTNDTLSSNQAVGGIGFGGSPAGTGRSGGAGLGGGLYLAGGGSVTLNNDTLSSNQAVGGTGGIGGPTGSAGNGIYEAGNGGIGGAGSGGALYVAAGSVTMTNDTLSSNNAVGGKGGKGGYGFTGGSLHVYPGSGGNGGTGSGGGLYAAKGTVTLNDITLSGNNASGGNGGLGDDGFSSDDSGSTGANFGGGMDVVSGSNVFLHNTLIAANLAGANPADIQGSLNSASSYDLIGDGSGGLSTANHNLLGSSTSPLNPLLAPLANNGGPTLTMVLLAGSPALNAGDNANAPAYDQRGPGFPRIVGGTIDIGAFEVQNNNSNQASSLDVTGFPSVAMAGSAGSFTVTAKNAEGTTDTNYTGTVHFTSSDPLAVLPANYTFTAADAGAHTFSATLKMAGTQSITASDTTTGSVAGSDMGIIVKPAAASRLVFGQQSGTTKAGQTISPAVTVDVNDQYGNQVTGDSSTVTLTLSSNTFAGGSSTASVTASRGVATFAALTIDRAGSYTLKATDGNLIPAGSGSFIVQAAAASTLSVTGFPTSTTAGVSHNFTITLRDLYGNIATGYTGTVHFTSSDRKATLPANYTFTAADAGMHTFSVTLKTSGTQSITATDTTAASLTGKEGGIKVNPAAAGKFLLTAPASVSAGAPFSLTVTVEDAYGNVVVGYSGTIHFGSTDTRATLPVNYTFTTTNAGVHTFTGLVLRKKGNQKISITDTHNSALTDNTIVDVL